MILLLSLLIKFCSLQTVSCLLFCVQPDNSSFTDHECKLLDYYVTHNFTDDITLTFLPGVHTLTGSIWIHDVSDVHIFGATDEGVSIECTDNGGIIFQYVTNVTIESISFVSCGQSLPDSLQRDDEAAQAAVAFGNVTNLQLNSVSVRDSHGYGILGHCVYGNFTISGSSFVSNYGSEHYLGGNAAIEYTNCSKGVPNSLHISFSRFLDGGYSGYRFTNYSNTLATGLMIILSQTNTTVMITDVVIKGNVNKFDQHGIGGNLFLHFYNKTNSTSNSVTVQNSILLSGIGYYGGGISVSFHTDPITADACENRLVIQNCTISNNSAEIGGGMYVNFVLKYLKEFDCPRDMLMVEDSTFDQNKVIAQRNVLKKNLLGRGIAVHIAYRFSNNRLANMHLTYKHFNVTFSNCDFTRSQQYGLRSEHLEIEGIGFMIYNGHVAFIDCTFADNKFTAVSGYRSRIELSGEILLENNTGINGGGLRLCESYIVFISNKTRISFAKFNNRATVSGGAMYVEESCPFTIPFCAIQFLNIRKCLATEIAEIVMLNNTAGFSGEHLYGGSFDDCRMTSCNSRKLFDSVFTIWPNSTSSSSYLSAICSRPERVCFCLEERVECGLEHMPHNESIFPGAMAEFQAAIVGQYNGTVPGTILVQSHKYEHIEQTTKKCVTLRVPVKYDEMLGNNSIVVLRVASHVIDGTSSFLNSSQSIQLHVTLKVCPPGFQKNTSGMCDCVDKLKLNNVQCDIGSQTVTRSPPSWIGYSEGNEDSGIIYHEVCPYDYCSDSEVNITSAENVFDQDSQCASNRSGLLCSKCKHGLSENLESSECLKCKTEYYSLVLSILGFIIAGILLVLALALLNITYTDGMLSGLLFYANVINLNSSIFLPAQQIHDAVRILISWQSLNPGFKSCLYNGMDAYGKAWLRFLFPVYLFSIIAIIILLCRKFKKIAYIFGGNVIKVLATLLLLSYSKLIDAVVIVLSFTLLHYPSHSKPVWLSDATLGYFAGRHLPLALVAVVFGLLILAYTLVLLFVQPLQRYSHLRCFFWVARLKPLIDAYTSPHIIKDNCRYWEGLLLLFRLVLAVIFAVNIRNTGSTNLAAIVGVCLLLLTVGWSVGGVYKKRHLNILNSFCILHLAVFALAVSYNTGPISSTAYFKCIAYISYCLQVLALVAVIACCVFLRVKNLRMLCKGSQDQQLENEDFNEADHEDAMYLRRLF